LSIRSNEVTAGAGDPRVSSEDPTVSSKDPTASSEGSGVSSEDPRVSSKDPTASSKGSGTGSEDSGVDSDRFGASGEGSKASSEAGRPLAVPAGRVGRAHGLDGSFYVTGASPRLLALETTVVVAGRAAKLIRRAGTDEHPIVRLAGIEDRGAAETLRGAEITVELAEAPVLEEGEWWAQELEGCEVVDGERHVGTVVGLMELPSCEALEVRIAASDADSERKSSKASGVDLLVPMVREAIRHVDPVAGRIDIDMSFLGETQ
jgi:16S rRNA processing protein RimM